MAQVLQYYNTTGTNYGYFYKLCLFVGQHNFFFYSIETSQLTKSLAGHSLWMLYPALIIAFILQN